MVMCGESSETCFKIIFLLCSLCSTAYDYLLLYCFRIEEPFSFVFNKKMKQK